MRKFNPSPNDSFRLVQLKAYADNKINATKKTEICFWEGLKTLGEKEKMLVNSIFFLSPNVFRMPLIQDR